MLFSFYVVSSILFLDILCTRPLPRLVIDNLHYYLKYRTSRVLQKQPSFLDSIY